MSGRRSEKALGIWVIVSSVFYLPLTYWATNAWQLNPIRPLLYGTVLALAGVGLYLLIRRFTGTELPLALTIATGMMVLMSWAKLPAAHPIVLAVGVAVVGLITTRLNVSIRRGLAIGFILFFGVGSVGQAVISHVQQASEIPLVELPHAESGAAHDTIEDVLVVIIDSYPSLTVARDWFGHDVAPLEDNLTALGYQVPEIAWSQHPNTGFSIPALMELTPVIDTESNDPWGNLSNLSRIIGGDNLVSHTLRSAGYTYTHIESGWHQGTCHDVDVCVGVSWMDETTWHLIEPSIAGRAIVDAQGSWMLPATTNTYRELLDLRPLFDDGERDYVYAHLLLPHSPYVVDEQCEPEPDQRPLSQAISEQLACTDQLISNIARIAGERTAVLLTADHGTKTDDQMSILPEDWTDHDIAEAFGIFMAYRMPDSCPPPVGDVSTLAMRAIVECAADFDPPPNTGEPLIGRRPHRWVSAGHLAEIAHELKDGRLRYVEAG